MVAIVNKIPDFVDPETSVSYMEIEFVVEMEGDVGAVKLAESVEQSTKPMPPKGVKRVEAQ